MTTTSDRIQTFHRLHASGCFVMPNPWDAGSARALEQHGFMAVATTSAGFELTRGRSANQITRDQALEHLCEIMSAVNDADYGILPMQDDPWIDVGLSDELATFCRR